MQMWLILFLHESRFLFLFFSLLGIVMEESVCAGGLEHVLFLKSVFFSLLMKTNFRM